MWSHSVRAEVGPPGLRRVNRQFAVEVTDPHPLSTSKDPKLTLSKWWPGGRATFNINGKAQWDAVRQSVDELSPYLSLGDRGGTQGRAQRR